MLPINDLVRIREEFLRMDCGWLWFRLELFALFLDLSLMSTGTGLNITFDLFGCFLFGD